MARFEERKKLCSKILHATPVGHCPPLKIWAKCALQTLDFAIFGGLLLNIVPDVAGYTPVVIGTPPVRFYAREKYTEHGGVSTDLRSSGSAEGIEANEGKCKVNGGDPFPKG